MKILKQKRCIIGEGPIWNEKQRLLFFTNGYGKELCKYNPENDTIKTIPLENDCAAFAFDKNGRLIVSRSDGVFILSDDESTLRLYDTSKHSITYANDMKVGPDGRIYVGTQSQRRMGISNKTDGKLYSVDKFQNVKILLDGMSLSNGMAWSLNEEFFYHTDSDTNIIKEYEFDAVSGEILFTGRSVTVPGVDGFTTDTDDKLYAACWGYGHIAVVDLHSMSVCEHIKIPCSAPTSCCFIGKDMNILAITSASYSFDIAEDKYAGFTFLIKRTKGGKQPYLFG